MDAVGYIRVSSKAQTLDTQRASILRAAEARGDAITVWYEEKASGKTTKRLELARLRSDAATGLCRRLYVFKLDRLTRSGVSDTYEVVEGLNKAGCELIAIADNLHIKVGERDTTTDVILFALGLAAKLQRQAINENIAAARERIEDEGGHWGRPRRSVNVALFQQLKSAGKTIREIAIACKVPRSTVARALNGNGTKARTSRGPL